MSVFEDIVGPLDGPEVERAVWAAATKLVVDDLKQSLAEVREGHFPITWLIEPLARYGALCALELHRDAVVELLPDLMNELAAISDAL